MSTFRVEIQAFDSTSVLKSGRVERVIFVDADDEDDARQKALQQFLKHYPNWQEQNVCLRVSKQVRSAYRWRRDAHANDQVYYQKLVSMSATANGNESQQDS